MMIYKMSLENPSSDELKMRIIFLINAQLNTNFFYIK